MSGKLLKGGLTREMSDGVAASQPPQSSSTQDKTILSGEQYDPDLRSCYSMSIQQSMLKLPL